METTDTAKIFLTKVLPMIQKLIEKEKEHIFELEEKLKKVNERGFKKILFLFFTNESTTSLIEHFISEAKKRLEQYEVRRKEYEEWVINN